jgi:hypothetical protein
MISGKNPQAREINQKRGPTVGNVATGSKRKDFMEEKDVRSGEKAGLAKMVTDALEMRGKGVNPYHDPALEGIKAEVNEGRGPTRGNAGKGKVKMRGDGKGRGALGATSGY